MSSGAGRKHRRARRRLAAKAVKFGQTARRFEKQEQQQEAARIRAGLVRERNQNDQA